MDTVKKVIKLSTKLLFSSVVIKKSKCTNMELNQYEMLAHLYLAFDDNI